MPLVENDTESEMPMTLFVLIQSSLDAMDR